MHINKPLVPLTLALARVGSTESTTYTTEYLTGVSNNTIQVLVEGTGPAVIICPSFARDSADDFHGFSTALAAAGYRVLRPQPRGMLGSTLGATTATATEALADWALVIDQLGAGKAVALGHAAGKTKASGLAVNYPDKVPAIILASWTTGQGVAADVSATSAVVSNYTYPAAERLAALEYGYFAPGNNASAWLEGWWLDVWASDGTYAYGLDSTPLLDVIPVDDPWRPAAQWNYSTTVLGARATVGYVENASHALFPENLPGVVDVVLPWLDNQTASWV